MPPKASPGRQIILQDAPPELKLDKDLKAPNLIAFSPAPAPPPVERPKPKAFIPPPDRPLPAPQPAPLLDDSPRVETSARGLLPEAVKDLGGNVMAGLAAAKPKRPVKAFVPPSSTAATPKQGGATAMSLDGGSAPAIPGGTSIETVTAAIIGLDPSSRLEAIPLGSRPAQLSTGPNVGPPSSGASGNGNSGPGGAGGIRIPDISVSGGVKGRPDGLHAEPTPKLSRPAEYRQTILGPGRTTLSVPLRSSSRTIPAALEALFRGRNVYTMVVPISNLPQYSGDWIIWFAEREQKPGESPQIRGPMPARKIEMVVAGADSSMAGRVQLGAIVRKDGHVDYVSVIKSFDARINPSATEDLLKWEFSPASRDNVPIDVDVVLEIPFRLAAHQ